MAKLDSTIVYGDLTTTANLTAQSITGSTIISTTCLRVNETEHVVGTVPAVFESTNSADALRVYGDCSQTGNGVAMRIYNKGNNSTAGLCGLFVDAYYSTAASTAGRSHGIISMAGNKTDRYNYGIIGMLCGTQDGAGIYGSVGAHALTNAGLWAGFFKGAVGGTTTICATSCVYSGTICGTSIARGPTVCATTSLRGPIVCNPATAPICMRAPTTEAVRIYDSTGNDPYISWYCSGAATRIGYMRGCGSTPTTSKISICADGGGYLRLGTSESTLQNGTKNVICSGIYCSLVMYASNNYMRYNNSNKLTTVSNGIIVGGCGCATDWIATSDCRLKDCIVPITSALSKVDALCGRCYIWCEDGCPDMGLIAQDVVKVEPMLVVTGEKHIESKEDDLDDPMGLKYEKMAGLFVEAIKELKQQNECLQKQVDELKNN